MAIYTIAICLVIFLLPLVFLLKKLSFKTNNKNHPPQPPKLPVLGNLHQIGNSPHQSLAVLSKKYGPVMLLHLGSVPTVIISSPESAKEALKTNDLHCCSRPLLNGTERLSYNFKDVAFSPCSKNWRELKKIIVLELFSTKRVQQFLPIREEEVSSMIKSVSESASTSTAVNISEVMFGLMERVMFKIAFRSVKVSKLDNDKFQKKIHETLVLIGSFAFSDFFPYTGRIVDRLTGLNKRIETVFHEWDGFFDKVIDDHTDPERVIKQEHEDVVDVMLRIERDYIESGLTWFTKAHIKAVLMNILLAGVDAGTVTVIWALSELIKRPKTMKKAQDEIRSHAGKKGKVTQQDLDQFQYLKMVIKETLRLHPPGPPLLPRVTTNHIQIQGYDIYPNTRMYINVWAIGRDATAWKEPDEFNPERFLNNSIDFKGQNFEFLPFGSGRRICPGMYLSTTMLELVLANLLYFFDWKLPNGTKEEDVSMEEENGPVALKKIPLKLVPVKFQWPSEE